MKRWALYCLLVMPDPLPGVERGSPPVDVYDAQAELGAAHISTDVAQLADGRIVVGNQVGLLRFDGVRWEQVRHPGGLGGMEHLAVSPDGRVHTSFNGDIGYFQDDATGQLRWHSTLERIPAAHREVGDVLDVAYDRARAGVWIATFKRVLFVPDGAGPAAVLGPLERVHFGGLVGADYWVQHDPGAALSRADLDAGLALVPVPGGDLVQAQKLWAVAGSGDQLRLATDAGDLLRVDAGRLRAWSDALKSFVPPLGVRSLLQLADGRYVVGSERAGPLILDVEGRIVDHYDERDGVPGQRRTHGLFQDRDGDLWLAQDRSIVRLALARGVTVYDERRGLPSASDVRRWRGDLYASSGVGLFRLRAAEGTGGGRFERVLPQLGDLRSLAVLDDQTLLASGRHVHAVGVGADGELTTQLVFRPVLANVLESSRFAPRRVWIGHSAGVARLDRQADGAILVTPIREYAAPVYRLAELDADGLWVADRVDGVTRLDVAGRVPPRHYGVAQGLPPGQVRIFAGPRQPWFTTTAGLRVYDAAADRFVVPDRLPQELQRDRLYSALEDHEGNLWVRGGEIVNELYWREGAGWRADRNLLHVADPAPTIFSFLREGRVVWAVRATGLLRFDLDAAAPLAPPPAPLLARVDDLRARSPLPLDALQALGPTVRDLRFDLALPVLHRAAATSYRSRLDGFDDAWSEWGGRDASHRVYTNLPDGTYRFAVEARDAFGRVVPMVPRELRVAPPWWRSTFARVAYVSAALLALWLASRWGARRRQRQLLGRQRELEQLVERRTKDLRHSNAQLAAQAERLAEVDRLKTRFFINVGHEFRTPLTLVLGPLDDLLRDARERLSEHAREQLEMANRNARRVLDLIVELLDVNRLEHRQMRPRPLPTDLAALARRTLDEHAPLLARHGHRAELDADAGVSWLACVDAALIERCLGNLLGNAAKYMPRGGLVGVQLRRLGEQIEVAVSDQGRGISAAALPHVFDRFFQAEGDDRASGYGIGLALVREIVEAHGGRVGVESTPGVGSRFFFALPADDVSAKPVEPAPAVLQGSAASATPSPERVAGRPLVLVVDDHDDLRARARALLGERFEVVEAADGPGAWNLARDRLPDVIVSDVMMPGFDGIELTRRLRADPETAAIAVLLLTAKAGSEHAAMGLHAGADDYLAKPFDASELLARIDALLARAQRLRLRLAREAQPQAAGAAVAESDDARWRRRLDELIARRLDDPELSVEQLAEAMHVDRTHLFRRCKELLAQSPSEYLREARLKRAHQLLEQGIGNVSEVAYAVGFESLSSFTRAFKTRYAMPPSHLGRRRTG